MAVGLTDYAWSCQAYIRLPVHTDPALAQQMDRGIVRLLTPALRPYPRGNTQEKPTPVETKEEKKDEANSMPTAA
jgi:hypothetical protein